jgi:hypothetical protein
MYFVKSCVFVQPSWICFACTHNSLHLAPAIQAIGDQQSKLISLFLDLIGWLQGSGRILEVVASLGSAMQVPFMGGLTMYVLGLDQQCTIMNLVAMKEMSLGR